MQAKNHRPFTHTLLAVMAVAVLITACGAPAEAATEPAVPATPTTVVEQPTSTTAAATDAPTEVSVAPTAAPTEAPVTGASVSFTHDIMPIFETTCLKCHGVEKTEKGLDMQTHAALMAGSERGAVVVPGDAAGSRLAELVMNGKMPKRGTKLTAGQVQLIVDWINAGAPNN